MTKTELIHLWSYRLFYSSIVIYLIVLFHPLLTVIVLPKATTGKVVGLHYDTYSGKQGKDRYIYYSVITYSVDGKNYEITGAGETHLSVGDSVDVLYNRFIPRFGVQYCFKGFLYYKAIASIWIFFLLSGFFYASTDYLPFRFSMKRLPFKALAMVIFVVFIIPPLTYIDLFIHGTFVQGITVDITNTIDDVNYRMIVYNYMGIKGETYTALGSSYYQEWQPVTVLVNKHNPLNAVELSIYSFYKPWQGVLIILVLIFMSGWYYATFNGFRAEYPDKMV